MSRHRVTQSGEAAERRTVLVANSPGGGPSPYRPAPWQVVDEDADFITAKIPWFDDFQRDPLKILSHDQVPVYIGLSGTITFDKRTGRCVERPDSFCKDSNRGFYLPDIANRGPNTLALNIADEQAREQRRAAEDQARKRGRIRRIKRPWIGSRSTLESALMRAGADRDEITREFLLSENVEEHPDRQDTYVIPHTVNCFINGVAVPIVDLLQ